MEVTERVESSCMVVGEGRKFDLVTPILLLIVFHAQFKLLVLTSKTLYGFGPGYLKDDVILQASFYVLK